MKSVVNSLMGLKECTRCKGGIFAAWRTIDNKRFYHPHCFTCVVCRTILDEVGENSEMQNLKEIYCQRCFQQCFKTEDRGDCERSNLLENTGWESMGGGQDVRDLSSDESEENLTEFYHHNQNLLKYSPGTPDCFKYQSTPNEIEALTMEDNRCSQAGDFCNVFNNSRSIHDNFESISKTLLNPIQRHFNNEFVPNQGLFNPRVMNQHYQNTDNSPASPAVQDNDPVHKKYESIPTAFLNVMSKNGSNIRKLERSRSRIPRPTTTCLSRKEMAQQASSSEKRSNKSKGTSSSSFIKLGHTSHSFTNGKVSNSPSTGSNSSKMQRSTSLIEPNKSKKKQSTAGACRESSPKKINRSNKRRLERAATTVPKISKSSFSICSVPSRPLKLQQQAVPDHVTRCLEGECEKAPSFISLKSSASFVSDFSPAAVEFPDETLRNQSSGNNIFANRHTQGRRPETLMNVPSPQAILSAIGRENSNLKRRQTVKEPVLKPLLPDKTIIPGRISSASPRSSTSNVELHSPLSSQSFHSRPTKWNFHVTFECPICISSLVPGNNNGFIMKNGNGNVVTSCGHLFHRDCLENWLKIKGNKRCPICSSLCLPETLQPVYLECNVTADFNSRCANDNSNKTDKVCKTKSYDAAFKALRSEYDLLKAKYNEILAEKNNYSLKVTIANSLQSAYDMECRNRLKLQWENKKLFRQLEELQQSMGVNSNQNGFSYNCPIPNSN